MTETTADGTSVTVRPRSADEQRAIDDDIDSYLRDAGVPPRPRGYRWFLQVPTRMTSDVFWQTVNKDLADRSTPTHPAQMMPDLRNVLDRMYAVQAPEPTAPGPPYRDYTDEPLPPGRSTAAAPEPGTGTVFVRELEPGWWSASWQAGPAITEMEGGLAEVAAWAWQQPAAVRVEWSESASAYVALRPPPDGPTQS